MADRTSGPRALLRRDRRGLGLRTADWSPEAWLPDDDCAPLPSEGSAASTTLIQIVDHQDRNFARFADELDEAEDITVYLNTSALGIVSMSPSGPSPSRRPPWQATARSTVTARAYVVATGGIENARLLLASTARSAAGVGNQRDLVGRFFGEHPRFTAGSLLPTGPGSSLEFYAPHSVSGGRLSGYLTVSRDVQRRSSLPTSRSIVTAQLPRRIRRKRSTSSVHHAAQPLPISCGGVRSASSPVTSRMSWATSGHGGRTLDPGAPLPMPYPELVGELMRRTPVEQQALIPDVLGDIAEAAYRRLHGAAAESAVLAEVDRPGTRSG